MSFISSRTAAQALLFTISGYAFYTFYNVVKPMGLGELLAREAKASRLPQRDHYIGIRAVDNTLTTLNRFFWPVTNNQSSLLNLQAFQFAGQFAAIWMIIMHESSRASVRHRWISYTTAYGLLLQVFSYAVTFPLWLAAYLGVYSGPSEYLATKPSKLDAYSIMISIGLGFFLPTVLCALPVSASLSVNDKLGYMAIWQVFPLWTGISHQVLRILLPLLGFSEDVGSGKRFTQNTNRALYIAALALASTSRCLGLMAGRYTGTTNSISEALQVGLPRIPQPSKFSTLEEAVGAFLAWDDNLGTFAVSVWALHELGALYSYTFYQKVRFVIALVAVYLVAGPAGVIVVARWTSEEIY